MNTSQKIIAALLLILFGASLAVVAKIFLPIGQTQRSPNNPQTAAAKTSTHASPAKLPVSQSAPPLYRSQASIGEPPPGWPPKTGQIFPDLNFTDSSGKEIKLTDYKGKVILIELAAMSCPASQSLAGAHQFGGFGNVGPQPSLGKLARYVWKYTDGADVSDSDFQVLQVLFYDLNLKTPSVENLKKWEEHFRLDEDENIKNVIGPKEIVGDRLFQMIPGFFLIDKNFVLRYDITNTGRQPLLYSELFPMLPQLLLEQPK